MISAGRALLYSIVLLATGCTGQPDRADTPNPDPKPFEQPLSGDTTLTAIGELQAEDTLEHAKRLFPAPPGAEISSQPELTLPGETHYGWSTDTQVFDAFASGGKLATVSLLKSGLSDAERQTQIDRELERFDEPTENAEGRTCAAYLWRDGDYVRIVVDFSAEGSKGILKVAGVAASLEARGFPISNISDLVAAFDERDLQ